MYFQMSKSALSSFSLPLPIFPFPFPFSFDGGSLFHLLWSFNFFKNIFVLGCVFCVVGQLFPLILRIILFNPRKYFSEYVILCFYFYVWNGIAIYPLYVRYISVYEFTIWVFKDQLCYNLVSALKIILLAIFYFIWMAFFFWRMYLCTK